MTREQGLVWGVELIAALVLVVWTVVLLAFSRMVRERWEAAERTRRWYSRG